MFFRFPFLGGCGVLCMHGISLLHKQDTLIIVLSDRVPLTRYHVKGKNHNYLDLQLYFAGIPVAFGGQSKHSIIGLQASNGLYKHYGRHHMLPCSVRMLASNSASQSSERTSHEV